MVALTRGGQLPFIPASHFSKLGSIATQTTYSEDKLLPAGAIKRADPDSESFQWRVNFASVAQPLREDCSSKDRVWRDSRTSPDCAESRLQESSFHTLPPACWNYLWHHSNRAKFFQV